MLLYFLWLIHINFVIRFPERWTTVLWDKKLNFDYIYYIIACHFVTGMVYYISFCVWQFIRLLNFTMCICGIFNAILINIILWICIESSCGMYGMFAVYFYVIYIHVIFLFLQGTRTIPIFSLYISWTLQSLILFFELYCKLGSFVIIYTCIFVHKCTLIFYMQ